MYSLIVDAGGRIIASAEGGRLKGEAYYIEMPDAFDVERQQDWRIEEGVPVHDPLPEALPLPTVEERVEAMESILLAALMGGMVNV